MPDGKAGGLTVGLLMAAGPPRQAALPIIRIAKNSTTGNRGKNGNTVRAGESAASTSNNNPNPTNPGNGRWASPRPRPAESIEYIIAPFHESRAGSSDARKQDCRRLRWPAHSGSASHLPYS